MGKWTDKDTSKYTGDDIDKVSEAEHDARDHATKDGVFERGNKDRNSERFDRNDSSGSLAEKLWDSIFKK